VELANGAAVDARKESKVLQDLVVLAEKRCKQKKQNAEDGASKKSSTNNKRKQSGKENSNVRLMKTRT
jgi:hypothetical protein